MHRVFMDLLISNNKTGKCIWTWCIRKNMHEWPCNRFYLKEGYVNKYVSVAQYSLKSNWWLFFVCETLLYVILSYETSLKLHKKWCIRNFSSIFYRVKNVIFKLVQEVWDTDMQLLERERESSVINPFKSQITNDLYKSLQIHFPQNLHLLREQEKKN